MFISDITNEIPTSFTSDLEKNVYEKLKELEWIMIQLNQWKNVLK